MRKPEQRALALLVMRPGPAELVEWFAVRALPVQVQASPARVLAPVRALPAEARAQQK